MDIKEIRVINLKRLLKAKNLKKSKLAETVSTNPAYLSQILNPQHRAQLGDDLARRIEVEYELPHGWMDKIHEDDERTIAEQRLLFESLESQLTDEERGYINELMEVLIKKRQILKQLM